MFSIKKLFPVFFICCWIFSIVSCLAQETVVKGKVTDSETGEALSFVSVYFNNINVGTATDFEGMFVLKTTSPVDSITASFFGYTTKSKVVKSGITQTIDFQLTPEVGAMEEVVISTQENPAFRIMRNVVKHKESNDKRNLSAFEYESFSKTEVSVDNISQKMQDRKVMKEIAKVYDSLKSRAGDDGKPVLPVFVSEAISNFYYRTNPIKTKEVIQATKISGLGITDGSFVSQLIGTSFQEYNFYKNWLNILNKDIISPIADEWHGYYNYVLEDSAFVGNKWCYKLKFTPKRSQDLAFTGFMWIADTSFALQQIDATIDKRANINYIEKVKIQQELEPTVSGAWLPSKTRILIDVAELKSNTAGLLIKFYISNKYFNVNNPRPPEFYDELLVVDEDARQKDASYWNAKRHDSLSTADKYVYSMIDSIKNVPTIKTYTEIINIAVNGYKTIGKIDVGPYLFLYNYNNIEGSRVRLGFKTNINFSRKWIIQAYGAYGTKDERFKYSGSIDYLLSRKNWTSVGVERRYDIDQLGVSWEALANSNANLFLAFTRWGTLRGPYYSTQNTIRFQRNYTKDFSQKIMLRHRDFTDPLFPFAYYKDLSKGDSILERDITVTEVTIESRYAKDEYFLQNDNNRISLGTKKWPVFTIGFTYGMKNVLGGQFDYQKVTFKMDGLIRWGSLGRTYFDFTAGKVFSTVPYPLLEVHLGNQSPFYTTVAFNLMRYFEFVSDTYVSLRYRHYFEGLLFNRIPLIQKLKWRFLTTGGIVYGGISKKNIAIIPPVDENGNSTRIFSSLADKPYIELGYGIENIFKILRIDAFHRLTYTKKPDVSNFGVKFSFQFVL